MPFANSSQNITEITEYNEANFGSVLWFAQKWPIGLVVVMIGGKHKQTVGPFHEGTELAQNDGQIWTHACRTFYNNFSFDHSDWFLFFRL